MVTVPEILEMTSPPPEGYFRAGGAGSAMADQTWFKYLAQLADQAATIEPDLAERIQKYTTDGVGKTARKKVPGTNTAAKKLDNLMTKSPIPLTPSDIKSAWGGLIRDIRDSGGRMRTGAIDEFCDNVLVAAKNRLHRVADVAIADPNKKVVRDELLADIGRAVPAEEARAIWIKAMDDIGSLEEGSRGVLKTLEFTDTPYIRELTNEKMAEIARAHFRQLLKADQHVLMPTCGVALVREAIERGSYPTTEEEIADILSRESARRLEHVPAPRPDTRKPPVKKDGPGDAGVVTEDPLHPPASSDHLPGDTGGRERVVERPAGDLPEDWLTNPEAPSIIAPGESTEHILPGDHPLPTEHLPPVVNGGDGTFSVHSHDLNMPAGDIIHSEPVIVGGGSEIIHSVSTHDSGDFSFRFDVSDALPTGSLPGTDGLPLPADALPPPLPTDSLPPPRPVDPLPPPRPIDPVPPVHTTPSSYSGGGGRYWGQAFERTETRLASTESKLMGTGGKVGKQIVNAAHHAHLEDLGVVGAGVAAGIGLLADAMAPAEAAEGAALASKAFTGETDVALGGLTKSNSKTAAIDTSFDSVFGGKGAV